MTRRRNSSSVIMPRRILLEAISACSERIREASCSADISSEKKPTTAVSGVPSGFSWNRCEALLGGDVEGDVGGERGLAHRRASGEDDQVGGLQAAHHVVEIDQAGWTGRTGRVPRW